MSPFLDWKICSSVPKMDGKFNIILGYIFFLLIDVASRKIGASKLSNAANGVSYGVILDKKHS